MRILAVTNLFPPHAYGGYEALCARAVAHWREGGHAVAVLTSDHRRGDVGSAADADEAQVHRRLPIYWDDHHLVAPGLPTALAWERTARRATAQVLDAHRPDVVAVFNAAALPLGLFTVVRRRGIPVLLVIGDRWLAWAHRADGLASRLGGRLVRVTAPRLGDPVVACFATEHLRRHAAANARWPLDDLALVPHGVDTTDFPPVAPEDADRTWSGRLLYAGRVAPEKDVVTAVRALDHLDAVRLDVLGPPVPGEQARIRGEARRLGVEDRVRLHGAVDAAALRRAYLRADALVFPSRWPEPFGITPLEAMASALPVVATGTGGSGEFLLDGHTALRFAPGDPAGLAAAVRRLADRPALAATLRRNGLALVRWLDQARCHDLLLTWCRYLADPAATPRPPDRPVLPPELRS